jgi:Tfp pilus assembly PilM family ATPase
MSLRIPFADLLGASSQSRRREQIVAIDLGAAKTKAVFLQRKSDRTLLAGCAISDAPAGEKAPTPEVLGPHLRALVSATGARVKRVTLVVGPNDAILRHADMPMVPIPDMRVMLKLGSKNYLQQELPDYLFDCQVQSVITDTKKPESQRAQKCRVLVGGAKRPLIEDLRAAAKLADLSLDIVTSSLIAPANAFELAMPDPFANHIVALVDVGAKTSTISIIMGGQIALNRVVNYGSARVIQGVKEALGVDAKESHELADFPASDLEALLPPLLVPLGRELRASIDFFEHQEDKQVVGAFFSGGLSRSELAVNALHSELLIQCHPWNPFASFELALPPDQLAVAEAHASQFAVAVGGAIAAF